MPRKSYYQEHVEELSEKRKEYYKKNKERILQKSKEWTKEHMDKVLLGQRASYVPTKGYSLHRAMECLSYSILKYITSSNVYSKVIDSEKWSTEKKDLGQVRVSEIEKSYQSEGYRTYSRAPEANGTDIIVLGTKDGEIEVLGVECTNFQEQYYISLERYDWMCDNWRELQTLITSFKPKYPVSFKKVLVSSYDWNVRYIKSYLRSDGVLLWVLGHQTKLPSKMWDEGNA